MLKRLEFDDEVLDWVSTALKESQSERKRESGKAVSCLRADYDKLENRIDRMYEDKLDGNVSQEDFNKKSGGWREEQSRIRVRLERHQAANSSYIDEGIRILELARSCYALFIQQSASEKRRLLNFVVSNCSWKNGVLEVEYRQPFGALAVAAERHRNQKAAGTLPGDLSVNWRPQRDSNPPMGTKR